MELDSSYLLNFYVKYTSRGKTNELTCLHFYSVDMTKHLAEFLTKMAIYNWSLLALFAN